jgi:hypothetical protein
MAPTARETGQLDARDVPRHGLRTRVCLNSLREVAHALDDCPRRRDRVRRGMPQLQQRNAESYQLRSNARCVSTQHAAERYRSGYDNRNSNHRTNESAAYDDAAHDHAAKSARASPVDATNDPRSTARGSFVFSSLIARPTLPDDVP